MYESALRSASVEEYLTCYKDAIHIRGMENELYFPTNQLNTCKISGEKGNIVSVNIESGLIGGGLHLILTYPTKLVAKNVMDGLVIAHQAMKDFHHARFEVSNATGPTGQKTSAVVNKKVFFSVSLFPHFFFKKKSNFKVISN